jgi:hypothetical protein
MLSCVMLLSSSGFSVVLTTLSIPLRDCKSDALGNPFIESFYIFIYIHHTCADLIFSGHTATYTLFALFWSHYSRGEDWRLCGLSQIHHHNTPQSPSSHSLLLTSLSLVFSL